jgi:hypothetical protein
MSRRFQVGEKVVWAGVQGTIIKDFKFKSELAASLLVEFEAYGAAGANKPAQKITQFFMYDGRLSHWHKEPSLERTT